jgi:exosortase/archaeosortase family protein
MQIKRILEEKWGALPSGASSFLKKAVGLFIGWKLLYILVLLPLGEPDGWLVRNLGDATVWFLNVSSIGEERYHVRHMMVEKPGGRPGGDVCAQVYSSGMRADIGIFAPCNGLELMVLAVGFILCFNGGAKRKALYVLLSITAIFLVNVLRCSLLVMINAEQPAYFEFAHKYLFNLVSYVIVFLVWMHYVNTLMRSVSGRDKVSQQLI